MRRLFIGVNFTKEEKAYFAHIQNNLKEYCRRGRFTHPENFHLTLRFLGLLPSNRERQLMDLIDAIYIEKFFISADHIGCFSKKQGFITYIGFKPQQLLTQLVADLNDRLREAEIIEQQVEPVYTPHITLGRNTQYDLPLEVVFNNIVVAKELPLTNITLYESINFNGKLTYRPLHVRKVI